MSDKRYIDVTGLTGVIVPMPTGVVWIGTAGGQVRDEPGLEGIFIPYELKLGRGSHPLTNVFNTASYDETLAQEFLEGAQAAEDFTAIDSESADRASLGRYSNYMAEAWLPVRIKLVPANNLLSSVADLVAILVWKNSILQPAET
jgi:hypothetical protein